MLALTTWSSDAVATGGPLLLALVLLVESLFPPIPSEVVLPLAGFLIGEGALHPVGAVAAATLGSVAGAVVLYEVGRFGGRPAVLRYGRLLRVTPERLDRADSWMRRHGPKVVFAARLVPLARSIVSVPAGTTRMARPTFLLYTALGSLVWNAALIGSGWALGGAWEQAASWVGRITVPGLALAVVVGGGWWLRRGHRLRRLARTAPTTAAH